MSDHPTFYVHEKADGDLEDIFDYSVEQVFRDLAANPKLGRRFDPDVNHYFQYPLESHCVFYAPTGSGVEIFRILHKSMLPTLHL